MPDEIDMTEEDEVVINELWDEIREEGGLIEWSKKQDEGIHDDDVDALQKHYREMQQNKQTKKDK